MVIVSEKLFFVQQLYKTTQDKLRHHHTHTYVYMCVYVHMCTYVCVYKSLMYDKLYLMWSMISSGIKIH